MSTLVMPQMIHVFQPFTKQPTLSYTTNNQKLNLNRTREEEKSLTRVWRRKYCSRISEQTSMEYGEWQESGNEVMVKSKYKEHTPLPLNSQPRKEYRYKVSHSCASELYCSYHALSSCHLESYTNTLSLSLSLSLSQSTAHRYYTKQQQRCSLKERSEIGPQTWHIQQHRSSSPLPLHPWGWWRWLSPLLCLRRKFPPWSGQEPPPGCPWAQDQGHRHGHAMGWPWAAGVPQV